MEEHNKGGLTAIAVREQRSGVGWGSSSRCYGHSSSQTTKRYAARSFTDRYTRLIHFCAIGMWELARMAANERVIVLLSASATRQALGMSR